MFFFQTSSYLRNYWETNKIIEHTDVTLGISHAIFSFIVLKTQTFYLVFQTKNVGGKNTQYNTQQQYINTFYWDYKCLFCVAVYEKAALNQSKRIKSLQSYQLMYVF